MRIANAVARGLFIPLELFPGSSPVLSSFCAIGKHPRARAARAMSDLRNIFILRYSEPVKSSGLPFRHDLYENCGKPPGIWSHTSLRPRAALIALIDTTFMPIAFYKTF